MQDKVQQLLDLMVKAEVLAKDLQPSLAINATQRTQLIDVSKRLTRALQTPTDRAWEIFFQPHQLSILKTALEAGWLHMIVDSGETGVTVDRLATSTGADESLVRRLLRVPAAVQTIQEVGVDAFAATELSKLLCTPQMAAGLRHAGHDFAVSVSRMPEYFAKNGYQTPPSPESGIYNFTRGAPFLQYLSQRPEWASNFNTFMASVRAGKTSWIDVFPVERLRVSASDEILLVDIGGGKGHDLAEFATKKKSLALHGKLLLQDLPRVINEVPEHWMDLFDAEAHDFFTPQPHHHARTYYMRNILHGFNIDECTLLLKHIRDAMKTGYSTLLINEIVLPDFGCSFWGAAFDVTMMTIVSGHERTGKDWEKLLDNVDGLHLEKIWTLEQNGESLIEVSRLH